MIPVALGVSLALGTLAAAAMANRARCVRRAERDCAERLPVGDDGVVIGAAPIALDGPEGAPAVLLVHGGGDTPQTLRYLAEELHERGYTVRVPLLPGHGRSLRAFSAVSADAWLDAARAAYEPLHDGRSFVAVVGLSMGGALSVRLAAERRDLAALCLVAPYLSMPAIVRGAVRTSRLWGGLVPYVRAAGRAPSIHDPEERERSRAYGWFTPAALRALAATVEGAVEALPEVQAPTLVLQSRADNRIHPDAAQRAFARLGAAKKELEWVDGAHVLTVDRDRARVSAAIARWLEAHGARPGERRQAG